MFSCRSSSTRVVENLVDYDVGDTIKHLRLYVSHKNDFKMTDSFVWWLFMTPEL